MRATENVKFSGISVDTGYFTLSGGKYQIAVSATFNTGNVQFLQLGPGGATELNINPAFTANGVSNFDIPPGQYRFAITLATSVFIGVTRIPGE